ncbi:MAG TPA: hypothetical protein VGQ15_14680, partial [Gaiellaceae bacterium]|nr:hypothetical protein [Gaiellaceae bacterium]
MDEAAQLTLDLQPERLPPVERNVEKWSCRCHPAWPFLKDQSDSIVDTVTRSALLALALGALTVLAGSGSAAD